MLNTKLLTLGNVAIIGAIVLGWHIFAKPLYNIIEG